MRVCTLRFAPLINVEFDYFSSFCTYAHNLNPATSSYYCSQREVTHLKDDEYVGKRGLCKEQLHVEYAAENELEQVQVASMVEAERARQQEATVQREHGPLQLRVQVARI